MPETRLAPVMQFLRSLASRPAGRELSDGELLRHFVAERDEDAFAALMERHGKLVWRVCRGRLPRLDDAEDAFQATFVVLARKAGAIRKVQSLASWLYGVATRIAMRARKKSDTLGRCREPSGTSH